jgi:flagellar hook-basal body complex protein FliE
VIAPIGSIGSQLAAGVNALGHGGAGAGQTPTQAEGLGAASEVGQSEALAGPAGGGPEGGFSSALSSAISSLDSSQQASDSAAQALATGTVSDPESAVVTVQDAQLEMQLASQIRTKATEAIQSVFQTQV